jgi:hypothetical protein
MIYTNPSDKCGKCRVSENRRFLLGEKKKPGNKESPLLPGLLYALLFLKQTKLRARHLYEFT